MRTAARLFSWSLSARVPSRQPSTSTSAVEKTRASLCGGMSLSSAVRLKGSVLGIKYLCRLTLKRRGVRLKIMRDKILKYGKYSNPRTDPAMKKKFIKAEHQSAVHFTVVSEEIAPQEICQQLRIKCDSSVVKD